MTAVLRTSRSRSSFRRLGRALESSHATRPMTVADRSRIGYSGAVSTNVIIEVDKRTAEVLESRAAELGVTVPQLIAELALDSAPREADPEEIAELDRRYAKASEGSRVPHDRVVQWLRTWGTPRFRQWPGQ